MGKEINDGSSLEGVRHKTGKAAKEQVRFVITSTQITKAQRQPKQAPSELRPWQAEAFNLLKDEDWRRIVGPTGSGKTRAMMALAIADYLAGYKVIVAYPQNTIADGFLPEKNESHVEVNLPEKGVQKWNPTRASKDVRKTLKKFLAGAGKDPRSMTIICSHAGLTGITEAIVKSKAKVSLFVDEAH